MKNKKPPKGRICAWKGCRKAATVLASGIGQIDWYCDDHAGEVADCGNPEYVVQCPNCDCYHGVN